MTFEEQWNDMIEQWREIVNATLKERGMSRSALARQADMTPQQVTDYLNGHRTPGSKIMDRFFAILGIDQTISPRERHHA